jgi:N-methylhydantoinase A
VIEVLSWTVFVGTRATRPQPLAPAKERTGPSPLGRRAVFDGRSGRAVEVPVYERAQFTPGACVRGPALVIEDGTSTFVTDRFDVMLDAGGALVLERKGNGPSPYGA